MKGSKMGHRNGSLEGPMNTPFGQMPKQAGGGKVMNHNPTPAFSMPRSSSENPEVFFEGDMGARPAAQLSQSPAIDITNVAKGRK